MRSATNIERILCDVHDLCMSVANGHEKIVSASWNIDDDLIVKTTDGRKDFEWTIGFGDDENTDGGHIDMVEQLENPVSYQEFMDKYDGEMFLLECYNKNGVEISDMAEIQPNTKVIAFSRRSGAFDVVLDM